MAQIVGYDDNYGGGEVAGDMDQVDASKLPQNFAATVPQTLAASAVGVLIQLQPLRVIRPDRIVFDRVQAAAVLVNDIKIGTTSLNASNGSIPADAFAPDAQGTSMRATMTASQNLAIWFNVTNKTAAAITNFAIGVIGPSMNG
jgi:hypothetical protein